MKIWCFLRALIGLINSGYPLNIYWSQKTRDASARNHLSSGVTADKITFFFCRWLLILFMLRTSFPPCWRTITKDSSLASIVNSSNMAATSQCHLILWGLIANHLFTGLVLKQLFTLVSVNSHGYLHRLDTSTSLNNNMLVGRI